MRVKTYKMRESISISEGGIRVEASAWMTGDGVTLSVTRAEETSRILDLSWGEFEPLLEAAESLRRTDISDTGFSPRGELEEILRSLPLVEGVPEFFGDVPTYVKTVVGKLKEKADAYDFDQEGISSRRKQSEDISALRAEVARLHSELSVQEDEILDLRAEIARLREALTGAAYTAYEGTSLWLSQEAAKRTVDAEKKALLWAADEVNYFGRSPYASPKKT